MRVAGYFNQRSREKAISKWRPIMIEASLGEEHILPVIKGNEWRYIAEEWNKLMGILRGEAQKNLIDLAWNIRLHHYVKNHLYRRGNKNKLFAIVTLGHMRASMFWYDLIHIMKKNSSIISLVAAQALIQINAERALKEIIGILQDRSDWHWAGVAHIFRLSVKEKVCPMLEEVIKNADKDRLPGLLRLFDTINCDTSSAAIGNILKKSSDERVISICLHIINDPMLIHEIRQHLNNSRWHVRMHAATALGRLGLKEDIPILVNCLQDREWWVRYRAAQSLSEMPFMNMDMLEEIYDSQQDRYAKDILRHVISERLDYAE